MPLAAIPHQLLACSGYENFATWHSLCGQLNGLAQLVWCLQVRQLTTRPAAQSAVKACCSHPDAEPVPGQSLRQAATTGLVAAAAAASLLLPFQAAAVSGGATKGTWDWHLSQHAVVNPVLLEGRSHAWFYCRLEAQLNLCDSRLFQKHLLFHSTLSRLSTHL